MEYAIKISTIMQDIGGNGYGIFGTPRIVVWVY
jgi:hypothetical protein